MIESFSRTALAMETNDSEDLEQLDPKVLSSILISIKLSQTQEESNSGEDPHSRLLELMHSAPIRALLDASVHYSKQQGIAPHEGLQQIVTSLQDIDKLWNIVLMKEGLSRLSSQYH